MSEYDPKSVEPRWQARWEGAGLFHVKTPESGRRQFNCLEMLPYPSGILHMGHVRNYSLGDAIARFHRMKGEDVFHGIGWDAFGMPAENAAIRKGEHPRRWTLANIDAMRGQLQRLGFGYDWSSETTTCLPEYYRWNQWMFLRMMEKGLAYRARRLLNWCDSCATVLANEQVDSGRCWRCDTAVVRKEFEQWFLRITDYAQELLEELDRMEDWPDKVRTMQRNWIGRSEGSRIFFPVVGGNDPIEVFTTRVDTIFGATYMALAVEHPRIPELVADSEQRRSVEAFVREQLSTSLEDRFEEAAEKLGVFTGRHAVNPYSGEKIPIWVANFVLMDVGTGAVMSVPAHDERDFAFAGKYGLPIRPVIHPQGEGPLDPDAMEDAYTPDGVVHDSGPYSGLDSAAARTRMNADAAEGAFGSRTITYRLKDWGVSRQRYWGTPIPVVHCPKCGPVAVPDGDLPVLLPEDVPLTGEGGSPLGRLDSFVNTTCPQCGGEARRDTDTMDTFVDSCWYYFRYLDSSNDSAPFDWEKLRPWFPVDLYIGGIEHATGHLIYTRFWSKVMRDLGMTDLDEPVARLFTQGMVIKDGFKMSKSRGNVVDPDTMVDRYGADTTRLFSLFAAPPEKELEWSEKGVEGCHRFLGRVWRTFEKVEGRLPAPGTERPKTASEAEALALRRKIHQTIKRVTDDLGPRMHLNTAVAAQMELINTIAPLADDTGAGEGELWALREAFEALVRLLAPFAPHFAEEIWARLGGEGFVSEAQWPVVDESLLVEEQITLVVQVNGKLRARLELARNVSEEAAVEAARADKRVAAHLEGKGLVRAVFVPGRLLNLVVK
jgi:leucyl-tRNA synthetase